jgi:WD40 repeat protein
MPNPDKLKLVKDIPFKAIAFGIALQPKSQRAFIGCSDFKVYDLDFAAAKFEPKELYGHESYVTTVALSGNVLVSGGYDGKLIWWDTKANKQIRSIDAHSKWIRKVVVSSDGKNFASVADDMFLRVWEVATGNKVLDVRGHEPITPHNFQSMLYAVTFSPDGTKIATADKTAKIIVWDSKTGSQLATMEAPIMYTWDPKQRMHSIGGPRSLAFSPDGKLLAVGGTGKIGNIDHLEAKTRIEIFDWQEKKQVNEFTGDKVQGIVNHLEWSPDGAWLLGAGGAGEGGFVFMDPMGKKIIRQDKVNMHVHHFAMNETADTIYSVGHNKLAIHEMKEPRLKW